MMARGRGKKVDQPEILLPFPGGIQARARAKVGSTSLTRLAWLLDLLNRPSADWTSLSEKERRELEAEVVAFCDAIGSVAGGQTSHLSVERLHQLCAYIRGQVLGMLQGGNFELEIPAVSFVSLPDSRPRYIGLATAIFPLAVAKLIEEERPRIRMCARSGCGRLFVRRKRAVYCSRQCSQVEQFKRYVARHESA